jgi:hypothetical protein
VRRWLAGPWQEAPRQNFCAIGPRGAAESAAIGQAHCRRDPAWAISPAGIGPAPYHRDPATAEELPAATVPVMVAYVVMVGAAMAAFAVTVEIVAMADAATVETVATMGNGLPAQVKVEVVNNGGQAIIGLVVLATVTGSTTIFLAALTIGDSGTAGGRTIGRTSITTGAIGGTTIGTVATIGSMAIGGTTIPAIIGIGRAMGTGGGGRLGDR